MVFHVQKRNYLGFFVTCDKTILVRRGDWVGEGAQPSRKFNYHPNEETRKIILKYRNKLSSFIIKTGIYIKIPRDRIKCKNIRQMINLIYFIFCYCN